MTDTTDLDTRLGEELIAQLQEAERQLDQVRQENSRLVRLLDSRDQTVNETGQKILQYMPKLGEVAANTSTIAGQMMQQKPIWESIDKSLAAIAKALQPPKEKP